MQQQEEIRLETKHFPPNCPDCELVYAVYYCNKERAYFRIAPVVKTNIPATIVYCQASYGERYEQTFECLKRVHDFVDYCILIVDDSFTQQQLDELVKTFPKLRIFYKKWTDNFPEYRNEYLKRVVDVVGSNEKLLNTWVLVSDPDEFFDKLFLKDLRSIISKSNGGVLFNLCKINSHDVLFTESGEKIEKASTFYKELLFKWDKAIRYVGVGWRLEDGKKVEGGLVHETLLPPIGGWRPVYLPNKYFYQHVKTYWEIWERAARNFWINGGGNNELTDDWFELMKIAEKVNFPKEWSKAREAFRKGSIPKEIKDWLIAHRNDNARPNVDCEKRDFFKWYFYYLHPEENTGNWKSEIMEEKPKQVEDELEYYIQECYKEILGRDADLDGIKNYTELIKKGIIKKEHLPKILMESPEYRAKKKGEDIFLR